MASKIRATQCAYDMSLRCLLKFHSRMHNLLNIICDNNICTVILGMNEIFVGTAINVNATLHCSREWILQLMCMPAFHLPTKNICEEENKIKTNSVTDVNIKKSITIETWNVFPFIPVISNKMISIENTFYPRGTHSQTHQIHQ